MVLRWEYLPGSVAYLVYTGVIGNSDDERADFRYTESFFDLLKANAHHTLMLKLS